MFPTCSKRHLAGRNALSATDLTISPPGHGPYPPPTRQRKSIRCWDRSRHPNRRGPDRPRMTPAAVVCWPALWGRRPPKRPPGASHLAAAARCAARRVGRRRCSAVGLGLRRASRARTRTSPPAISRSRSNTAKFPTAAAARRDLRPRARRSRTPAISDPRPRRDDLHRRRQGRRLVLDPLRPDRAWPTRTARSGSSRTATRSCSSAGQDER